MNAPKYDRRMPLARRRAWRGDGCLHSLAAGGSMRTRPAVRSGYFAANAQTTKHPNEWPTKTHGGCGIVFVSTASRSSTMCASVGGRGSGSLQASPARSYAHTRANAATRGCTCAQLSDDPAMPASRRTAGPLPVVTAWRRRPPTSIAGPGMMHVRALRRVPISWYSAPAETSERMNDRESLHLSPVAMVAGSGHRPERRGDLPEHLRRRHPRADLLQLFEP